MCKNVHTTMRHAHSALYHAEGPLIMRPSDHFSSNPLCLLIPLHIPMPQTIVLPYIPRASDPCASSYPLCLGPCAPSYPLCLGPLCSLLSPVPRALVLPRVPYASDPCAPSYPLCLGPLRSLVSTVPRTLVLPRIHCALDPCAPSYPLCLGPLCFPVSTLCVLPNLVLKPYGLETTLGISIKTSCSVV